MACAHLIAFVLCSGCADKKKSARTPALEERAGSRALDYVPRGADFAAHVNAAKLRKSPLFLALVGTARNKVTPAWLAAQEKACGFPFLYAFEDVVFTRGEDGDLAIARLGVGTDEMSACWAKTHTAALPWPAAWPSYELAIRDGLAFFGDRRAITRMQRARTPTVRDPRHLELSADESARAQGSIEIGPFRSTDFVLETTKQGFRAEAGLDAFSEPWPQRCTQAPGGPSRAGARAGEKPSRARGAAEHSFEFQQRDHDRAGLL